MNNRRFTALDGLRGIAALVVVVHHSLLVAPRLAEPYLHTGAPMTGWAWWMTYTPLHLFWAGTEAVYLFFVLSGFVLARPLHGIEEIPGASTTLSGWCGSTCPFGPQSPSP